MTDPAQEDRPGPARAALRAYLDGRLPSGIAAMRMVLATASAADLERILDEARSACAGRKETLERLASIEDAIRTPQLWQTINAIGKAVPHDAGSGGPAEEVVGRVAGWFDRAAEISPEASVALYSLGDEMRLAAATDEIVAWMRQAGVLGADRDMLDVGCGIGRLELALHAEARRIVGIDVSAQMVAIASRRCAMLANVDIRLTSGLDLSGLPDRSFDCAIAIDTFPYLVLAGEELAARHFDECARVLRTGGDLLILNYSYRGSLGRDRTDIRKNADAAGFKLLQDGIRPFKLWDGTVFRLVREERV